MPINIEALRNELDDKKEKTAAKIRSIGETCQAERREKTEAEAAELQTMADECRQLRAKIDRAIADESQFLELERLTTGLPARQPRQTTTVATTTPTLRSWGQLYTASDAYEFHRLGRHRNQANWQSPSMELPWPTGFGGMPIIRGATLTEDPASGGAVIIPQYLPGIQPLPFPPMLVADLFAQGTTTSNLITYMREKVFTNAAAPVAEGALKPESTLTFESASEPVRKIAHWLPVTEEMLEDEPAIRAYIDSRLRLGVLQKEESQLLHGTGTPPELSGLLDRAGLAVSIARTDPQTNADALLAQKMAIFASSLLMPDGFILNPVNWTGILLTKTTQGTYLAGGPFSPLQTPTLWGDPVAVTPATAAGVGIVGAFKTGAQVFRKGGVRVETSNSHADFFVKNLVAIRAEERLALAVYRPGAFGTVTALT